VSHYRLDHTADIDGTSLLVEVELIPTALVHRFGLPSPADGYKVSGEYTFVDDAVHVFTVYDWKSTSLYARELPTPEEFWSFEESMEFSIGGHEGPFEEFVAWLRDQLANTPGDLA
jgi:hypothetical protein